MGKEGYQVFSIIDFLEVTFRIASGNVHVAMVE